MAGPPPTAEEPREGPERPPEGRSARKHRAILSAAGELFLRQGYLGTSVDEIAASAGVSKQTVYKHFDDKQHLFTAVVFASIDHVGRPFYDEIHRLEVSDDLEADLRELAKRLSAVATDQRLLQVRRLVIGEAARFPELGHAYYERAVDRTTRSLETRFRGLAERGLLRLDDPYLAAQTFIWLVLSVPLNRAMFSPETETDAAGLRRIADEAVRIFLAAYGATPASPRRGARPPAQA